MYFSQQDYFNLFEQIGELGLISQYYGQSLNDDIQNIETHHSFLRRNTQNLSKFVYPSQDQNGQNLLINPSNLDVKQYPETIETHFQEKLNQIQEQNNKIIEKLLICQQKIEKQFQKSRLLQRNHLKEYQLKEQVQSLRSRVQKLNDQVQNHQLKIQHEEKLIHQPNEEQKKTFEEESLHLVKDIYDEYQKQSKSLERSKIMINQFKEILFD